MKGVPLFALPVAIGVHLATQQRFPRAIEQTFSHPTIAITVNFHTFYLSLDIIKFTLIHLAIAVSIELCPHRFAILIESQFFHTPITISVHLDAEQLAIAVILPLVGLAIVVVIERPTSSAVLARAVVTNSRHPSLRGEACPPPRCQIRLALDNMPYHELR